MGRPAATIASIQAHGDSARSAERATVDTIAERLARRAVARGDRTLDILMLSAGGQNGAYGAGFLRGWRARSDASMPRFDLVTGVSTGALQAPFALLGTTEALDTVAALYRNAAEQIAPSINWLFWLRRDGGLVNTERLERTVERVLDGPMRDQIREQLAAGRQLAIGSTDLDLGVGRTWNLDMDSTTAGLARVHTLLRASSAIPGIFPPVVIDGHVHADGGVVSTVLSVLDFESSVALVKRLRAHGVADQVTVRLWVVMNQGTHAPVQVMDPARRTQIHQRGDGVLYYSQQPLLLENLANLARAVTATVPGLRVELRFTAVPPELANAPGASQLFDKAFMRQLEQLGFDRAQSANPWDETTSRYERPPLPAILPPVPP
ncbi:MAG: patatin-like phospholipase family protein [Gemmatimonadaceae bacterium]